MRENAVNMTSIIPFTGSAPAIVLHICIRACTRFVHKQIAETTMRAIDVLIITLRLFVGVRNVVLI